MRFNNVRKEMLESEDELTKLNMDIDVWNLGHKSNDQEICLKRAWETFI